MAQMEWPDQPDPVEMRERYAAVVDLARRATFRTPESGWGAEQVLAHLAATTDLFNTVGDGVRRGERPDCGDREVVDDEALTRRTADAGGLAGLLTQLEASAARLVAQAESLTADEAATPVRFTVYHDGGMLLDEPRPWGRILGGHTIFHLPLHTRQLEALAEPE